ncbi:MAG: YifB family Mg chelatase-like AAA ATPase [Polyangia bacterium]
MLAQLRSAGLLGIDAYPVCVEVEVTTGMPGYHLVGLGHGAVKEGAVRVRAALRQVGLSLPAKKITVNLAPADVRKEGAAYDLPVAIGLLVAEEQIPLPSVMDVLLLGELGLDGALRRVAGGLAVALLARSTGIASIILPSASASEAAGLTGLAVYAADHLSQVVAHLRGEQRLPLAVELPAEQGPPPADLADVRGQPLARRALELAAAGGHSLLYVGPPGCGKSLLARRLPGILPPLSEQEALEASVVYSAAGRLTSGRLLRERPFRAPHHDISVPGLIGGGTHPRPGEISLAHHGVLFLDELPEFSRGAIESLRAPLEDRSVLVVRTAMSVRFPARFSLVAAMNPCPCGHEGSSRRACICDLPRIRAYRERLSGPMLDRFDLQLRVPPVELHTLSQDAEASAPVRERVLRARAIQQRRAGQPNAELTGQALDEACALDERSRGLLATIADKRGLSARAIHRVLRVSRTAADLDDSPTIRTPHLAVALEMRAMDESHG